MLAGVGCTRTEVFFVLMIVTVGMNLKAEVWSAGPLKNEVSLGGSPKDNERATGAKQKVVEVYSSVVVIVSFGASEIVDPAIVTVFVV